MASDNLIGQLRALGLIAQVSQEKELVDHLATGKRTVYCGFDPSADSLHAGNLIPLLALRRFQLAGHRPILLVGGATGLIGDPGGRTMERALLPVEVVEGYVEQIRAQASRFLDFDCGDTSAVVVNNFDWTNGLGVLEFLRDIGKHFSVNTMIQKESVRRRIEESNEGISYTEFSYMILQSYDFLTLHRTYGCTIQLGASDQWGNITSGIDLIRKTEGEQAYAVTFPLLLNADGSKYGKSTAGAVWLDAKRTSPYAFYQFWMNSSDADVMTYIRLFTFFDEKTIARLAESNADDPARREAHTALADSVTELVHGPNGLASARRITEAMFSNQLSALDEADLGQLSLDGLPTIRVSGASAELLSLLVESGLAVTPRGEVTLGQARKLVEGNAVSVNGEKVGDVNLVLTRESALFGRFHILQRGRKNHCMVEWME